MFAQADGGWDLFLYNSCDDYLQKPILKTVDEVFSMLDRVVLEIEKRVRLFTEAGFRNLQEYNIKSGNKIPYLIVVIDGMAEIITKDRRRFNLLIRRITAVARFCGIHIVMTTNTISTNTITSAIKSNIPTTIALAVSNQIQSRLAIDHDGVEKLLGKGDMLYYRTNLHQPIRIQGVLCGPDKD